MESATIKIRSIKYNLLMNMILRVSTIIFPMITFPYVTRVLGVANNGKIAFAGSVVGYFAMFAQLGIPTYGVRACASCRNDINKLRKIVQELLFINLLCVAIVYIAFFVCVRSLPRFKIEQVLLVITSFSIILDTFGMGWLFQALEQYSYITVRSICFKILSIILMFVFIHSRSDYLKYAVICVVANGGSSVLNLIYAIRLLGFKRYTNYEFKKHLTSMVSFFMLSVSVSIYTNMDTVMLGFLSDDSQVGYYSAATKMKSIVTTAVTALGGVLLPRMSYFIASQKISEFYAIIKKSFNYILIIAISAGVYLIIMSDTIIFFLAGSEYEAAIIPMQIISVTILLIGLNNITGMQMLVPTQREKITTMSTICGAIVNVIVNAFAIPRYGAIGATVGTVIAEIIVLFVQVIYLNKEVYEIIKKISIWKILVSNIIAMCCIIIVKKWLIEFNLFFCLGITGCTYVIVEGLILIFLKEEFSYDLYKRIVALLMTQQ